MGSKHKKEILEMFLNRMQLILQECGDWIELFEDRNLLFQRK